MGATGSDLAERDAELAQVEQALAAAARGDGRLLLVEGPAGIGKSRLLAEVRRRAGEQGALVLSARGSELEREFPFGGVRQLFEGTLAAPAERDAALAGAAAGAATVLDAPATGDVEAEGSFAALHGLYWLALNLAARRFLVLLIDDLHWLDRPTLRWLAYLVGRLEGQPILVAATQRSTDPGTDPVLLGELRRDPATVLVRPDPLGEASVAALVRDRLGEEAAAAFCRACHRATGGNPLLLRELIAALESDGVAPDAAHIGVIGDIGPHAVSRTVLLRLARLSASAVEAARAVAVLNDGADPRHVAALSGLVPEEATAAFADLARVEILRPDPPLRFVHPLVRAAVYEELPPGERELRHARAAALLHEGGASPDAVAAQLLATPPGGRDWAADLLQDAGRAATRRGAADNAVALLRRALDEPPRPERRPSVLLELGLAEALTSAPAGVAHLREALPVTEDPAARVLIGNALGRTLLFTGHLEETEALARRLAAAFEPPPPDYWGMMRALQLATHICGPTRPDGSPAAGESARLDADGPGACMLQSLASLSLNLRGHSARECASVAKRASADGELFRTDPGFLDIATCQTLTMAEDDDAAAAAWQSSLAEAHRRGSLFAISGLHMWGSWRFSWRGELDEAAEFLAMADREFELYGYANNAVSYLSAFQALVALDREDAAAARTFIGRGDDAGPPADGNRYWRAAHVAVLLAEGRYEDAVAEADIYAERYAAFAPAPVSARWLGPRAIALARLGRQDEARADAEEEVRRARAWGAPAVVSRSLRALAEVKGAEGLPELEEAVELTSTSTARLEHAKALAALGGLLRRRRRPGDAREPLRRALELAETCGASGLSAFARAELHAAGARPRREALRGVDSLTASERRVADLAAEGRTNREIAQELFVTPKTIEVHLGNAYRKLGVKSRRQLGDALSA